MEEIQMLLSAFIPLCLGSLTLYTSFRIENYKLSVYFKIIAIITSILSYCLIYNIIFNIISNIF